MPFLGTPSFAYIRRLISNPVKDMIYKINKSFILLFGKEIEFK